MGGWVSFNYLPLRNKFVGIWIGGIFKHVEILMRHGNMPNKNGKCICQLETLFLPLSRCLCVWVSVFCGIAFNYSIKLLHIHLRSSQTATHTQSKFLWFILFIWLFGWPPNHEPDQLCSARLMAGHRWTTLSWINYALLIYGRGGRRRSRSIRWTCHSKECGMALYCYRIMPGPTEPVTAHISGGI